LFYKKKFVDIGGQWAFIGQPEKPNGYGVIFLGGSIAFVSDKSSDWHENIYKKALFDSLLEEGYTIGYSNAHGANFGNDKAVQDIINLHQYMVKDTNIDNGVHLFAISMGGLLALRVMENANFVRSVVFSQPLLNVRDQRKHDNNYIQKNNLDMADPLGNAIASAHEIDYSNLDEYIEKVFSLEKLAVVDVPCKIWHGTGDENVPVDINAMPFVDIRIKNKLQIALEVEKGVGHDKEGACYSDHKGIIQFFHKNEK
jgi:esterase/lipase